MQITHVRIRRFRGFKDFSISLNSFTNLVGRNSRGKTTVLQAIQFVFDTVEVARTDSASITTGIRVNSRQLVTRLSLTDAKSIWHEKDASQPFDVELTFDNGYRLKVSNPVAEQATLEMFAGQESIPAVRGPEWEQLAEVAKVGASYIPPIGATSGLESWKSHPSYQQALSNGLHSEIWRNSLYWQYNDGDKSAFSDAVAMVKKYIDVEDILPPRQGHESSPSVVIEFIEKGQVYDIGLSGSGMRSILNLASILLLSKSRIIMLDEPDAHLHSALQRAVAKMIQDYSYDHGIQILVATHAPDFISECDVDSIVWVDKETSKGEKASELSRVLVDLGSLGPAEVFESNGSSKLLFVEGDLDRKSLTNLLNRIDSSFDAKSVRIANLPSGKSSSEAVPLAVSMLKNFGLSEVKVACLVDLDWEIEVKRPSPEHIYVLPFKEIENAFLNTDIITAVVCNELKRRNQMVPGDLEQVVAKLIHSACDAQRGDVRAQLIWKYRNTLPNTKDHSTREKEADQWFEDKWLDETWRLKRVGGKKALKSLRNSVREKYAVSISTQSLIDALTPIPEELKQCLEQVLNHLN